ncbi:aspartokinase [Ruminiclostridium hungatei]|uniref:aspartate kinase n=1 Tax=Ruminiclostridium hungatei TaxID=48256 RepID=A0A1V4SH54_RUMHU|nr:ACT domain-containing protein [Ruminiclostridium hungatei]OPX43134.1 aspartokinase [Ruminiclostridium hungatei]
MSNNSVTSMSTLYNVAMVTVDNLPNDMLIISDIFSKIAEMHINIDMITQSPPYQGKLNVSFSMPQENIAKVIGLLNTYKGTVPNLRISIDSESTKISIFGEAMKEVPGVAARLFRLLAVNDAEVKLVTTSEVDISFLIYDKDTDRVASAIKKEFLI